MTPTLIGNAARLATLKASIQGTSSLAAALAAGDDAAIATHYNAPAAGPFVVFKGADAPVSVTEIGDQIDAVALVGLTTGDLQALQCLCGDLSGGWIDPSVKDRRDAFAEIFSTAAGATTRSRLDALWRRNATVVEKLFATGTGSTASPATMGAGGRLTYEEVSAARNSP